MNKYYFLFLVFSFSALSISGFSRVFSDYENDTIPEIPDFSRMMEAKHLTHTNIYTSPDTTDLLDVLTAGIELPLRTITIVAVGDIMPGTNFPSEDYLPPACDILFNPVRNIIQNADVAVGNLEGVFSSEGGDAKNCKDPKTCYVFRMPDSYAGCIKEAGFDILGVANNHVNDFGYEGRVNTARRLDEEGVFFAGFPDRPWVIYNIKGLKIGFCAFAPHTGTLDFRDYENAEAIVRELDKKVDIVVVSFHGGAEGRDHQHITRADEMFLGSNRGNPWYFARRVIDAGADLVVGHGPHVVRAVEFYKEKLIAYSLGNFCTYARFNLSGPNANAPVLEVNLDAKGNYVSGKIHSFLQLGEGGPVPDLSKSAMKRIRELTSIDFPEQEIIIDNEGRIIGPCKN